MKIQINNLDNINSTSNNLQDISETEAAQIAGGGCDSNSRLYYDEGNYFFETVEVCGTVTTTVTTGNGVVVTEIIDSSLGGDNSGTLPIFLRPIGNPD